MRFASTITVRPISAVGRGRPTPKRGSSIKKTTWPKPRSGSGESVEDPVRQGEEKEEAKDQRKKRWADEEDDFSTTDASSWSKISKSIDRKLGIAVDSIELD